MRSKIGSKTNVYHLNGLIEELKPFAAQMVQQKKVRMAEKEARYRQKGKPALSLVKTLDGRE
ncbi:hypothetical protein [Sphingomonas paucimobilis]|uniref:hypothetical protein n=1 Tax=Sphingomonas paucimobilis TaxID=13689 RepID=UPI00064BD68D|nr:hypothetical protein [Sphingomonas paucimobilis]